ncbi:hypothetical protein GCM10010103_77930 [Streptomyces paradoxus]|uniref:WD40 repeat protein n=1 Tax=Streptomyces paradoxus TaxID=66375 RepID=A0A7W9TK65_9ACTN|nr:caspase family protein [Streptomyces paradoxus]MBB6081896.1 WD40 repeat protein [Streptomyces paradoxus]
MSADPGLSPAPNGAAGRRFLIASAVTRYPKAPWWDTPGLVEARDQVIRLFTREFGYEHVNDLGLDPVKAQLTQRLRAFARAPERRPDDLVALYLAGHGHVLEEDRDHVLLTSDADPEDRDDALLTADLVRSVLRGTGIRRLLLLLDTCYAGQGGNELASAALSQVARKWQSGTDCALVIMSSAQPDEEAQVGAFPHLLAEAVGELATAGHAPPALALDAVVAAMNAHPDRPGFQKITLNQVGLTGKVPSFLPNPRHNPDLAGVDLAIGQAVKWRAQADQRETEFTSRLLPKAMGAHDVDGRSGAWYFSGRHRALTDLTGWLRPDATAAQAVPTALAVTGGPGSGKSAVLGLVTALTHPWHRPTVPLHALDLPPAAVPPVGAVDVTIYAHQLTDEQVLSGMAAAARHQVTTPGEFLTALEGRDRPLTVIIDAVDEAMTPDSLVHHLLRPFIDHAGGRLRLLLGVRPHLLDGLGIDRRAVIDLDAESYADLPALTHYVVRGLLQTTEHSPFRAIAPERTRAVAEAVAQAAAPSFLVARITATTLAGADAVPDPADTAWRSGLPRLPGDAMRQDLRARLGRDADRACDLLRPLAWAQGQGLPWEDVWAPLAGALSGRPYSNDDLHWLIRTVGSYIVEVDDAGRSAYRLYHQALAEHLREVGEHPADSGPAAVHDAFVTVLLDRIPYAADGTRDWLRAHPYTRRHLATHAAASGRLEELIENAEYLVHADPETLLSALHHVTTQRGRLIRAVYRASVGRHRDLAPAERRCLLAVDAARHQVEDLRASLASALPWAPRWATASQASLALESTLAGHFGGVRALTCLELEGRPVAVSGGDDPYVRVWDLRTGTQTRTLTGHMGGIRVLACLMLPERTLVVAGDGSKRVRVWDLAGGSLLRTFPLEALSMACLLLDGRPVAVTGHSDGDVRVWDLRDGTVVRVLRGHTRGVRALACTVVDGREVVVTGDGAALVRLWDLRTGRLLRTLEGHRGGLVSAVACAVWDGRPIAITGDRGRRNRFHHPGARPARHPRLVRVWDLSTGTSLSTVDSPGAVTAVGFGLLGDTPVVVCGDDTGEVRVRELPGGRTLRQLARHTRGVSALACLTLDGRLVTVTGGRDREVRVWDTGAEDASPQPRHSGDVRSVACTTLDGRSVAVSAGADGKARVWRLDTGSCLAAFPVLPARAKAATCTQDRLGPPQAVVGDGEGRVWLWHLGTFKARLIGKHKREVRAVACTVLGGRRIAITGAEESLVRVWDLPSRSELCALDGHGSGVRAVACTVLDDQPVAVVGCDNGEIHLWDLGNAKPTGLLFDRAGIVRSVACAIWNGRPVLVTGGDSGEIHVRELTHDGALLRTFHVGSRIWTVACVVRDGRPVVVTGGWAGTVQLWDLDDPDSGGPRYVLPQPKAVPSVAVAPTSELVIASGSEVITLAPAGETSPPSLEW